MGASSTWNRRWHIKGGLHTLLCLLPQLGVRGLSCIDARLLCLMEKVIGAAQVCSLLVMPTPDVVRKTCQHALAFLLQTYSAILH